MYSSTARLLASYREFKFAGLECSADILTACTQGYSGGYDIKLMPHELRVVGGVPGRAQADALRDTSGSIGLLASKSPFAKEFGGGGWHTLASKLVPPTSATSVVLHKAGLYRIDVMMEVRAERQRLFFISLHYVVVRALFTLFLMHSYSGGRAVGQSRRQDPRLPLLYPS